MYENLIIGFFTISVCVGIQCAVVGILLRGLLVLERKKLIRPTFFVSFLLLSTLLLLMFAGNLLQILLWAGIFLARSEFTDMPAAFYHSLVNFSTLGYGDLVMSERSRLLGALEAANGVLMFGLTTGFVYTVMSELMERMWSAKLGLSDASGD